MDINVENAVEKMVLRYHTMLQNGHVEGKKESPSRRVSKTTDEILIQQLSAGS